MIGLQLATTFHLLGIIFWFGGLGARLTLLNSAKSGSDTHNEGRSRLYQLQRQIHLMLETPAFAVALLAGLFLVHATKVTFHQPWFRGKMVLVLGTVVVGLLTSRQFKAFNVTGERTWQSVALFASLVVFTLLALVAATTKF